MQRSRWLVPLVCLLTLPISLTLWAGVITAWLGVWGSANLAVAVHSASIPAAARALDGLSRAMGVASWAARGWGAMSGVLPVMAPVARAGQAMSDISQAGLAIAPVLPAALGEGKPVNYLICALNDAELFGSGGAPLDVAMVELADAVPSVVVSGSVAGTLNPDNEPYPWPVVGGPPWYQAGREYPFANSNFHPNFPFSGVNMRSAWAGLGQPDVVGVLTVDIYAVAEILRVTGPLDSGEYGHLTSENLVRKVLVDAYREFPDTEPGAREYRRAMNSQLRSDLIAHLSSVDAVRKLVPVLGPLAAGRHIQAFMAFPAMQEAVTILGADGALATPPGDIVGVFLQSGVSKLAVFQERRIRHEVEVAADGSAEVAQTVEFANAVPEGLPGDATMHTGYLALIFRQRIAFRMPLAAEDVTLEQPEGAQLVPRARQGPYEDQTEARVMWAGQDIPPGQTRTVILHYRLPAGTFGSGGQLRYTVTANPQAMVLPVKLDVQVRFASGPPKVGPDWTLANGQARWTGVLDRTLELSVSR